MRYITKNLIIIILLASLLSPVNLSALASQHYVVLSWTGNAGPYVVWKLTPSDKKPIWRVLSKTKKQTFTDMNVLSGNTYEYFVSNNIGNSEVVTAVIPDN